MIEIAENLIRTELTEMERARALARRKEIYEIRHPETRHGGDRKSDQTGKMPIRSFAADTASKTGRDESSVRRSVRIGERLTPEAEEAAKAAGLDDNQSALLNDAEWSRGSDREIARQCAVGADMVGRLRPAPAPSVAERQIEEPRTVSRGGTTYTMNTPAINAGRPPTVPSSTAATPALASRSSGLRRRPRSSGFICGIAADGRRL